MDMGIFVTLLAGFNAEPVLSDHRIIQVNFVPWEQMMQHCQRFNARTVGCYDGQIWMTQIRGLSGRYTLSLALDFVSWKDLGHACDEPACEIDEVIQASQSFNKVMNCSVGEIVFRQMDWSQKLYKEQCIVGHEIVHAFGAMHPREI